MDETIWGSGIQLSGRGVDGVWETENELTILDWERGGYEVLFFTFVVGLEELVEKANNSMGMGKELKWHAVRSSGWPQLN